MPACFQADDEPGKQGSWALIFKVDTRFARNQLVVGKGGGLLQFLTAVIRTGATVYKVTMRLQACRSALIVLI